MPLNPPVHVDFRKRRTTKTVRTYLNLYVDGSGVCYASALDALATAHGRVLLLTAQPLDISVDIPVVEE